MILPRPVLAALVLTLAAGAFQPRGHRAEAAVATGAVASPTSAAEPLAREDERLRIVRQRRLSLQRELDRLRGQERGLLDEVERLELEVRLRGAELGEIQAVLQRTNAELSATLRRLGQIEASLQAARPVLAARARALYKLGELSYVRLLLSVDRPSDVFRGYRFVTTLARRDNERIARFRSDLEALSAARVELERRTREALLLQTDLDRARRALDADRRRKTELLTQIVERKEIRAAYVAELAEAEERLGELLQGLGAGEVSIPIAAFRGELPWPTSGRLRGAYGRRKHPKFDTYTVRNGIDLEAEADAPVRVVHEGTVVFADRFRGYGLMVIVDHGGRHHSLYAHLGEAAVKTGQHVAAGDVVGTVGTSAVEGPGLYFEVRAHGRPEDPLDWLRAQR